MTPTIAILSFPGTWSEVESIRAIERVGMKTKFHKWNDDLSNLSDIDGYFIPGGFSYEDRGRAGMVAARDPLMDFLREEAKKRKPIIGICNGAQILVESGLIPVSEELKMSLARNVVGDTAAGFINEWIWITPQCASDRCCTSDWEGALTLQIPMSHGEGRYITRDPDLIEELKANDQIAFAYSDERGNVADTPPITLNGSTLGIAGICNPEGNIVALMPHPERTEIADPYFASMKKWIEESRSYSASTSTISNSTNWNVDEVKPRPVEVFIDTIITNNEERTVEQALRREVDGVELKQFQYFAPSSGKVNDIIDDLTIFNANKHIAYVRENGKLTQWNPDTKQLESVSNSSLEKKGFLRVDEPDTGAASLGEGSVTGVYYSVSKHRDIASNTNALEVLANPHASTLSIVCP